MLQKILQKTPHECLLFLLEEEEEERLDCT